MKSNVVDAGQEERTEDEDRDIDDFEMVQIQFVGDEDVPYIIQ